MFGPLVLLGIAALSALLAPLFIFVISAASLIANPAAATPPTALDTAAVTAVAITGEASSIALSARADAPYRATVDGHRTGWFAGWYSGWFFGDCSSTTSMRLDGATLRIDVADGTWLDTSDCTVAIEANVPAGAVVSVDQPAFMANLNGLFGGISLSGNAIDAAIDGTAHDIEISGAAVRAKLVAAPNTPMENVRIEGEALDADLRFGGGTISYKVEAMASFVDSALDNTPGAKPAVLIKGKFVRASIR